MTTTRELLVDAPGSVLDGIPNEDVTVALARAKTRTFAAGAVVVAEGENSGTVYVATKGSADVLLSDEYGCPRKIGRIEPGTSFGEMSLLTGNPAAATVRATEPLETIVVERREFERLACRYPVVYRNVSEILAERLSRTNLLAAEQTPGRVTALTAAADPRQAYALAASVAWHAQCRVALVAPATGELSALAAEPANPDEPGVDVVAGEADQLADRYEHVLVLDGAAERSIELRGLPSVDGSLEGGLLPGTSGPLARVARDVAGLRVGLALGAGSLRGWAHLGVLRRLERLGVPADALAGTSIGAAVAALAAIGRTADESIALLDKGGRMAFRPTFPLFSLLSGRALRRFVRTIGGDTRIEELDVPLGIVAADLLSRREIVFRRGPIWQAVVASMAIPGIYPALRVGEWLLVDGGVVDPVPSAVCGELGADVVISVRLGATPKEPVMDAEAVAVERRPPAALGVLLEAIEIMQSRVAGATTSKTSLVLTPDLPAEGGVRNFSAGRQYIDEGERAVEDALPRLQSALPWLRAK